MFNSWALQRKWNTAIILTLLTSQITIITKIEHSKLYKHSSFVTPSTSNCITFLELVNAVYSEAK